jgi:DNA-binding NtrC family response regulator
VRREGDPSPSAEGATTAVSTGGVRATPEGAYPAVYLLVECERPLEGTTRASLRGVVRVSIGRGDIRQLVQQGDELRIDVPDPFMSRDHAELVCVLGEWTLRDMGSRNGVCVDGVRVASAALGDGDVFEIGHTFFVFAACEREQTDVAFAFGELATHHAALSGAFSALAKLARSRVFVMISGETGTGKEMVAHAIHAASGRGGPFIALNCSALPSGLLESELFGHQKGAFTGATQHAIGVIRASHGGTLFLDEVAELTPAAQASLLRVLETSEVRPIGSSHATAVDLRVITATHEDLSALVEAGRFRTDLLARLSGYAVELPPLRARVLDLGDICATLLARFAPQGSEPRFTRRAVRAIIAHDWPHNVRGLAKALETALVLADGTIDLEHLPASVGARDEAVFALPPHETARRDELIKQLREHRGNVAKVARAMGKASMQIRRWAERYGLRIADYR